MKVGRGASQEARSASVRRQKRRHAAKPRRRWAPPPTTRTNGVVVQDCGGGWNFYTVIADVDTMFVAYSVHETDATGWFTRDEMRSLPLHPGFGLLPTGSIIRTMTLTKKVSSGRF